MPVEQLATAFPVTGITIALFASADEGGGMEEGAHHPVEVPSAPR